MENQIRTRFSTQDYLIITSKYEKDNTKNESNIHRIGFKRNHLNPLRQHLKKYTLIRFIHRLIWPDDKILFNIWSLIYYLLFLRKQDDHIYTVSHPFSSHIIGCFLKRFYKHVWTTDIGDLYYFPHQKAHPYKKWNQYFEQKILSSCDHILVNANTLRDYFADLYKLDPNKFRVVPNGNRLDFSKLKRADSNTLQMTFIGNTYEDIRDGLAEIEIFKRLRNEYPEFHFNLQLLGKMHSPLLEKISDFNSWIQTRVCNSDEELLEAYSKADVLLNFANKNYPGIPSKLEEYVASGIPIIHFCWQHNDPASIYLMQHKHPFLEFVIDQTAVQELKKYVNDIRNLVIN